MRLFDPNVPLTGKTTLLRLDLNVPINDQRTVTDSTRIDRAKAMVCALSKAGAKTLIISHFGRPKGQANPDYSLDFLPPFLSEAWGLSVHFMRDCIGTEVAQAVMDADDGAVILLENLRFYEGEEQNTAEFARQLSLNADMFVNDAFSASHRSHASIVGVPNHLPSFAGLQLQQEVHALETALSHPEKPLCAIVGGSKISTKLSLLHQLINKCDHLILGGGMANTFIAAQGHNLGASLVENDMLDEAQSIMSKAQQAGCTLHLPIDGQSSREFKVGATTQLCTPDTCPADQMILDIGTDSIAQLTHVIDQSKTLIWNGPLGVFEMPPFDRGTNALAKHVAQRVQSGQLIAIAGGGDTVAALNHAQVAQDLTYISTAGGAFLEWMEGKKLPGLAALS